MQQENFIYGFVPFWQPVAGQVMQVDFSAFTRLGYLGAVLGEDGSVARSPHWNDMHPDGLRAALRHGGDPSNTEGHHCFLALTTTSIYSARIRRLLLSIEMITVGVFAFSTIKLAIS